MQAPDINLTQDSPNATPKGTPRRPHLEARGFTERGAAAESPSLLAADESDPVDRVSNLSEVDFLFGSDMLTQHVASPSIPQWLSGFATT